MPCPTTACAVVPSLCTCPAEAVRICDGGGVRSRGVLWSVVIVVVLAAVAFAGWRYVGIRATAEVYAEAGQPRCHGVEVGVARQDDGLRVPAIPLREEMRCVLSFRVVNPGPSDIAVTGMEQAVGGPGGGAAFRVTAINATPLEAPAGRTADDIDARWSGDIPVEAGGATVLDVEVVFRASGCTTFGTLTAPGSVVVRGWGDERTVPLPVAAVFRGTEDSNGCDT